VNIGDADIKIGENPAIGPMVIQIGQQAIPMPEVEEKPKAIYVDMVRQRLDNVLYLLSYHTEQLNTIARLLTEIRDLSVPWYLRLWRWLKEKF